jgi:hypothetical protein
MLAAARYEEATRTLASFQWTKHGHFDNITVFYRNKEDSNPTFRAIRAATDEHIPYRELGYMQDADYNGNGVFDTKVAGLYFCATLVRGKVPKNSPYGPTRIMLRIADLVNPADGQLYFLNQYFVKENLYVVVVWIKNEHAWQAEAHLHHLCQLDIHNNGILHYDEGDEQWSYRRGIWLEIMIVGDSPELMLTGRDIQRNVNVTGRNTVV